MDFSEGDMHVEQEGNSDMVFNLPVSGQYKKKPLMLANIVGNNRQKHLGSLSIRGKAFNKFRTSHYIPELSNKTNLINLAKIAYNAYSTPIKEDWYNLTSDYDLVNLYI
jgi:putative lipase involved disintegration of autophagic bodies